MNLVPGQQAVTQHILQCRSSGLAGPVMRHSTIPADCSCVAALCPCLVQCLYTSSVQAVGGIYQASSNPCTAAAGGRTLFAGTDTGCLRAYKFPLTGEYQELKCCSAPISQLRMSHDENVLFAAGEDGALFVFDVRDRDVSKSVGKRLAMSGTAHVSQRDGAFFGLMCKSGTLPSLWTRCGHGLPQHL